VGALAISDRARRVVGGCVAVAAVLLLATVPLSWSGGVAARPGVTHGTMGQDWPAVLVIGSFMFSGVALIHARPRNAIGWTLAAVGILQAIQISTDGYGARALTDPDGSLPLGLVSMWVATWTWLPAVLIPVTVLPAIYPTGRVPNRFWGWQVRIALLGIGLMVLTAMISQGPIDDTVAGTRLPWDTPVWLIAVVGVTAGTLLLAATVVAVVGTLWRAVRAGSPERQQLIWLLTLVAGMLATVFLPVEHVFFVAYMCVPIAVVAGVLRYRLLGIEIVLRRTLLYLPLTLLVALTVGGLTTVLARLAPGGLVPLLLASAVVAVLVVPAAAWLRRRVDRFVLGDRVDPLALVDRVGADLEVTTSDPVPAMLRAVATAAGARFAQVTDQHGNRLAVVGRPGGPTLELPLRHAGEYLGVVQIGPRPGDIRVGEKDARLVAALAPQLAVVVRSRILTEELARERNRVTAATLAERDRLRRDLHDGLGPSLSGIALGLQAARRAVGSDPAALSELLDRTRVEAQGAVYEIRRVIDGLRPAALDRRGLVGAVRETATALGIGTADGPDLALRILGLPLLAPPIEEAAFRILAESLTNVARHAAATRCTICLQQHDGELQLDVVDDGAGVPPHAPAGHGLESMRRRATDLGGRVIIKPVSPHGTVVSAMLPMGSP
jgi:signal transduction histidine kinase